MDWHLKNGTRPKNTGEGKTFWTNEDFAEECGVTAKAVSNWRSGRNLPRELMQDRIEDKLFGRGLNAHPLSAGWQGDLRKAFNADFESSLKIENEREEGIVETYRERLKKEIQEIIDRLNNPDNHPRSRARQVFYGWQSLHGLSDDGPDPEIAFYLAKGQLKELEASYRRNREKYIAGHVATLRFYAFCMAALTKLSREDADYVVDTFVNSLLLKYLDDKSQIDIGVVLIADIDKAIDDTRLIQPKHRLESICDLLRTIGRVSKKFNISVENIYLEESSPHRKEGNLRKDTDTEKRNTATHLVDVYFIDHEGYYYNMLTQLLLTRVNFVRTISETIVPGKLARARLWVHCADTKLKHTLKIWLSERIPDELLDKIFSLSVKPI